MPAKAKVTKEMIVDAAFAIAREAGVENINARTVSESLHCSTQPVMYHFATMEELKRTVEALNAESLERLRKNIGEEFQVKTWKQFLEENDDLYKEKD